MDATEDELAHLGRSADPQTGNNTTEYVALQLGLSELLARYETHRLEMRIDSMTVTETAGVAKTRWSRASKRTGNPCGGTDEYPEHEYTRLADSDTIPAGALATVGADIAPFGPG